VRVQPGTDKLLAKAARAAATAAAALAAGTPDVAAGRAFSAMLHAAKALLNEHGLRLRTHARIAAAFERFAPIGDPPLAEWLAAAMARRRSGDTGELTFEDAAELVERADVFVNAARERVALGVSSATFGHKLQSS
jgi:uncharacterized protein (UPF0332 family)